MKIELTQSPLAIRPWRKERGRADGQWCSRLRVK
ncbi:unnamed protein product [Gulo gulo]|uniref:Uncharacterized protein n=1 Tax=Gulo gulo TaxID=48420 RepID=A0A9X9Q8X3_GULGU|nr:unnamed protein product [Gulo gulo]